MKLVDILAASLKEWPEGVREIDQSNIDGELYYDDRETSICLKIAEDAGIKQFGGPVVTRAQWQAAVDALNGRLTADDLINNGRLKSPALYIQQIGRAERKWSGSGLPPINTECEAFNDHLEEWIGVKVIDHQGSVQSAVCREIGTDKLWWSDSFRPVMTAEQLKADERSKVCDEMYGIMTSPPVREGNRSDMAEALYDAGFRRFELKDEQP